MVALFRVALFEDPLFCSVYSETTENKKAPNESELGANDGTRTHDLLITNQLLYRLSHISKRDN